MEMPNLPTDNLYKFLALFGLILIVFSSYMFNQTPEKLYSDIDNLKVKEQLLKIKVHGDSFKGNQLVNNKIEHLKDSLEFDATLKGLQRKVDRFPKLLYLYLILLLLGVAATIFGFIKWFFRTQKFNDLMLENESKKSLNDKSVVIHKIQFEKEFGVYNNLWPNLILLRNATQNLRPTFESYDNTQSEEDRKNTKIKNFNDSFNKCAETFDQNKPFYPEDIYKEIEMILRTSRHEAIEFVYMHPRESDYFKNAEKNIDEIISKIDSVCLKIRDRIGIVKVK